MTISEFQLIKKYIKPLAEGCRPALGLNDDTAFVRGKVDENYIVSKDIFVENVHFLRSEDPFDVATRLMTANLSDIAASGSLPKYYLLGLAYDKNLDESYYHRFTEGLKLIQDFYKIKIIGGDTVKCNKDLMFSLTIIGNNSDDNILQTNQAKIGDEIFVTGAIGDSFIYTNHLLEKQQGVKFTDDELSYLKKQYYKKKINYEFMNLLLSSGLCKCATDISDGLIIDLENICVSSGVSALLNSKSIKFSEVGLKLIDRNFYSFEDYVTGGEDFELIFTARQNHKKEILKLAKTFKIELNNIGTIDKKDELSTIKFCDDNIKLNKKGYEH